MDCVYCKRRNPEGAKVCEKCGAELLPIVDINALHYQAVDASLADALKDVDVNFMYKGDLKKVLTAISTGACVIVPVRVEETYEYDTTDAEDTVSSYDTYCKLQTLERNPLSHDVELVTYFNYKPADMEEAYLLRMMIKNKHVYLIVPNLDPEYIKANIKGFLAIKSNKTKKRATADAFDLATQKIGDFFSKKLFKKK